MEVHPFRLATNREARLSKVDIDACRMPCRTGLGSDWRALAWRPVSPRLPSTRFGRRYCFRPAEDVKNGAGHSRSHVISCRPV